MGDAQILLNNFLARLGSGFSECSAPGPGSTAGRQRRAIRRWRQQLAAKGQLPLVVDCRFGPSTELATKLFQTCKGLKTDGKIGPNTWAQLERYRAAPPAPRPRPGPAIQTATVQVVAKSVILPVGSDFGFIARCPKDSLTRLPLFAKLLDASVKDSCAHTRLDRTYRMFSTRTFQVAHDGARIVHVGSSSIATDSGQECILGSSTCFQAPGLTLMGQSVRRTGPASFAFSWRIKGRPHNLVEPGFQLVCTRMSRFIWHRVTGRIELKGGTVTVRSRIVGSRFPTHCLFVNGRRKRFVRQGKLSNLWIPDRGDRTLVR